MTQAQKETHRKWMMWAAFFAILAVMLGLIGLVYLAKPVADLAMIASTFFTVMSAIIVGSQFSKPGKGADDVDDINR